MKISRKLRFSLVGLAFVLVLFVVFAVLPRDIIISGDIGSNRSDTAQVDLRLLVFDSEKNGEIVDTVDFDDVALTSDGRFDLVYSAGIFSLPAQSYLQVCLRTLEPGMELDAENGIAICNEGVTKTSVSQDVLGLATDQAYSQVGCTRERVVSQAPGLFMRLFGLHPERYEFFNYCDDVYTASEFVAEQQQQIASQFLSEAAPAVQLLSLQGNKISISEGNTITLPTTEPVIVPDQVFQDISIVGDQLTLSAGSTVTIPNFADGTGSDDQLLSLASNVLVIESGNSVDLSSYLDNTDEQTLSLAGTDLTITNGNTVDLASINTDTLASLSCAASEVAIYNSGSSSWVCGATGGGVDTDDQTLSIASDILTIIDGNSVSLVPYLDNTDTQDLSLVTNTLSLTDGGSVNLAPYLDNTDALLALSCSSNEIAKWNGSAWACAVDVDTDTDTQLDETAVDAFVANNGYLTTEVDGSTTNELNTTVTIVGDELRITDAGGTLTADLSSYVDTNTTYTAGNGLSLVGTEFSIDSPTCSGTDKLSWSGTAFACSADVDTDTNLDETAVDAFVANNGYLTTEVDGSITNELQDLTLTGNTLALTDDATTVDLSPYLDNTDVLAGLSCSTNEIAKWNGSAWACAADIDTDTNTQLDETAVDAFVSNNGYLTVEVDGSTTNELNTSLTIVSDELRLLDAGGTLTADLSPYLDNTDALAGLSCSTNEIAKWDGSAWACAADVDTDTDTQLDETAVDAFVANNGYLTTEVDGSTTNELNSTLTIVGDELRLTDAGGTLTADLSSYLDDTNTTYSAGNGISLTGTTFAVDSPTCSGTDKLQWNGTAFVCSADVDTDTNTQLDETAVDAFVANNGYLTTEVDGSITNELQDLSLTGNTLALTDDGTTVDLSGYLDNTDTLNALSCSSGQVAQWNGSAWICANAAVDTDTQDLSLASDILSLVDGGSVSLVPYLDNTDTQDLSLATNTLSLTDGGSVNLAPYLDNTDALLALSCSSNEIAKWNGSAWACAVDVDTDTDTQLDETAVDAFVANNGYLTTEVDGSTTNELNTTVTIVGDELRITDAGGTLTADLSSYVDTNTTYTAGNGLTLAGTEFSIDSPTCSGTDKLSWSGTAFSCSADVDTDTNLDETAVDAFVANNGYLTAEVDGSITNELQDLSLTGNTLALTDDATTVDLSGYLDNTDVLAGLSCSTNEIAKWNGSAWACAADLDTDTTYTGGTGITISGADVISNDLGTDITSSEIVNATILLEDIAANGCSSGDVMQYNGSAWACDPDDTGTGGTFSFSLTDGSTTETINDSNTLTAAAGTGLDVVVSATDTVTYSIEDGGVTTTQISNGTILLEDIAANGCTTNQVMSYNGSAWVCADDVDTDTQDLSLASDILSLVDGGTVNLAPYLDNTDTQDLSLVTNTLSLTDGGSVDLAPYLDNTDALLALSCSSNEIAKWNGSAWACAPDVDTDTDTDTQLDETAVDAFVANNGYLTTEVDGSTTNELNTTVTIVGDELRITDAGGTLTADLSSYVDTNTTYTAGNGLSLVGTEFSIDSPTCSGTDKLSWSGTAFSCSADVDTDTNLDETAVDAFVANNGYLTTEVDGSITNELQDLTLTGNTLALTDDATTVDLSSYLDNTDVLAGLSCSTNEIAKWNGSAWACAADLDTDTQDLSLASDTLSLVDGGSVSLAPYLDNTDTQDLSLVTNTLSLTDGGSVNLAPYLDNTDALLALSCSTNEIAKWNGSAWACAVDVDTDTDTQLDETAVDAFVANNGYLTTEVDGSTTNELNTTVTIVGDELRITDAGGTLTADLSSYVDTNTTYTAGNGLSLVGTEFSIDSPTCAGTDKLSWSGTAFACSADVDTDTNLDETAVDAFVANNGYLTTEVDGSITNELQDLTLTGNTLALTDDATTVDLSSYLDNTDVLAGLSCSTNEIAKWNGSAWACAADLDTDTQDLSLASDILSLVDGGSVSLVPYLDNTDTQDLSLVTNTLSLTDGGSVNLAPYLDNTDALLALSCSTNEIAKWNGSAWACAADIDTDTDTQLDETAVDAFVANNGYLTTEVDGSTTNELNTTVTIVGDELRITDAGGTLTADLSSYVDTNTTYTAGNGLSLVGTEFSIDSPTCSGTDKLQWSGTAFSCSADVDTDTNLDETAVDAFVANNGYLTTEVDGSITNELQDLTLTSNTLALTDDATTVDLSGYLDNTDVLAGLSCSTNEIAKWNGSAWACAADLDTDTQDLSLASDILSLVDGGSVSLVPYLDNTDTQDLSLATNTLSLTDGGSVNLAPYLDNTDALLALSCSTNEIAKWNGSAWACAADVDTDTDTQLDETAVDAFVANNGYLTTEVDGSTTNELNTTVTIVGDELRITDAGGTLTADLSSYVDTNTTYTAGNGLTLAGTEFSIDSPTCSGTDKLQWSGTAFSCSADVDTDTNLDETAVDAFVANNGYLTTEVDGSITNELQDLSLTGNTLALTDDATTVDLSGYLDNTDVLAGLSCSTNEIAKWNGSAWACAADLDTDTQDLSLASDILSLVDGGSVSLVPYLDNTDTQDLSLATNTLSLTDGGSVNLAPYLDNTDALLALSCSTNEIAKWNGSAWACAADVDTDTDTQLDETAVDAFVANNGYLTTEVDGSTTNELNTTVTIVGDELRITDAGGTLTADLSSYVDTNTTYTAGNGLTLAGTEFSIDSPTCSGTDKLQWSGTAFSCSADVDTDTNLDETAVDAFVANNGYLTTEVDGSITNELQDLTLTGNTLALTDDATTVDLSGYLDNTDVLAGLSCSTNEVAKWNGSAWACAADVDTDTNTQLDETAVDAFVSNNGYLTVEVDGSTTNELNTSLSIVSDELRLLDAGGTLTADLSPYLDNTDALDDLSCSSNEIAKWNGSAWACAADVDTDTDTQLDETAVDAFVANNGYLTTEVDGSTTNELNSTLTIVSDELRLVDAGGTLTVDLSSYLDDTNTTYTAGNGISLTGTSFSINSPTCSGTDKLQWNGTAFVCSADVDTDTNTQLDETAVDAFVANNGYLTSESDGVIGNEVLNATTDGGLERAGAGTGGDPYTLGLRTDCADNEILKWDNGGSAWGCEADDNSGASYSAGNGLQLVSTTFSINSPTCSSTDKLQWNGTAFVCSADVDTNTQLDETAVDAFVADNGYLTAEVDAVIGNEVLNATTDGGLTRAGSGTSGTPYTLGLRTDCSADEYLSYDSTAWVCTAVESDTIVASGKIDGAGGTALDITGASFAKNGTGDYTITLDTALTTADYVVQVSAEEPTATLDDVNISVDNQGTGGFDVDVHEGDNGTTANVRVDRDWYFIVVSDADSLTSLSLDNDTLGGLSCTNDQVATYSTGSSAWVCADKTDFIISDGVGTETITDGNTITFGAGDGLTSTVSATDTITYDLDVATTGTTATTSSNSGLETDASGLRLLGGCADREVLKWNAGTSVWECAPAVELNNFVDTTLDLVQDNNTTDYWDPATQPNITPAQTTNEVLVTVTLTGDSNSTGNEYPTFRIERDIGADPTCNTDTVVGDEIAGGFTTDNNRTWSTTASFLDSPATTSNVRYTLCSDDRTQGSNQSELFEIHFTLLETNNAADLAEIYPTNDTSLSNGEIASVDAGLASGVKRSPAADGDPLGVVSTEPALLIGGTNGTGAGGVAVALKGRVPVKVSLENGPIQPGDKIAVSSEAGVGMRALRSGTVLGTAIESFDEAIAQNSDTVMIFVETGYWQAPFVIDLSSIFGQDSLQTIADSDLSEGEELFEESSLETVLDNRGSYSSFDQDAVDEFLRGFTIQQEQIDTLSERLEAAEVAIVTIESLQGAVEEGALAGDQDFLEAIVFEGTVQFNDLVYVSDSAAGRVTVVAGATQASVGFTRVYATTPTINLTPYDFVEGEYRVKEVSASGFIVELARPPDQDTVFSWSATAVATSPVSE